MDKKNIVKVIETMAEVISKGKFEVTGDEARKINRLFEIAAETINDLEAEIREEENDS